MKRLNEAAKSEWPHRLDIIQSCMAKNRLEQPDIKNQLQQECVSFYQHHHMLEKTFN